MSDDRYDTVPDYMQNAFRNIDRHYKQRKNVKGKLEQTDYTNVIDLRDISSNSPHNHDVNRIIEVATRKGGFNGKVQWDWKVEQSFNKDWIFKPSLNIPVTGDGCPPKKPKDVIVTIDNTTVTTNNDILDTTTTITPEQTTQPNIEQSTQQLTPEEQQKLEKAQKNAQLQQKYKKPAYINPNKQIKKNHKNDIYVHPFKNYRPDYSGECGSSSSKVYAIDGIPGLFVINRALHYTSQIVWALRCFISYEKDYTNLYNLHFVLPSKGVKEGLETLPDQTNVPDELKVNTIDDIQELFFKACSKAILMGGLQSPSIVINNINDDDGNNIEINNDNCPLCQHATKPSFFIHSHYHMNKQQQQQQQQQQCHTNQQHTTINTNIDTNILNIKQHTIHDVNKYDSTLLSLKRLRWASLGYHYDWTDREYTDENQSKFPPELYNIAQIVIQPLVDHGIVTPLLPQAGIINYYPIGTRMGAHIDDAEVAVECPIVSFSVGLTSIFVIGNKSRKEEPISLFLRSGDVLIQDGVSRLAFHSVPRIVEDSLPFGSLYIAANSLLDEYYRYMNDNSSDINNDSNNNNNNNENVDSNDEIEPTTPNFVPKDTLQHFIQLINDAKPLMIKYNVTIEQLMTFVLHVLCEYRVNFNTRQVQDPRLGTLAEVRQRFPIDAVKSGVYEGLISSDTTTTTTIAASPVVETTNNTFSPPQND